MSPTQIPGTTWAYGTTGQGLVLCIKTDGTLWVWGDNYDGQLTKSMILVISSPTQIGSDTTWKATRTGMVINYSTGQLKLMEHYGHGE